MNENESILYIKIKLGKRSICVKYAIRFLSVAAFFLMIEQTSFFITRHAAKNMLADKEQKEILMRLPPKSESEVRECTDGYFSGRVQCRYRAAAFCRTILGYTFGRDE